MGVLRFAAADVELFGAASHDRNPLHSLSLEGRPEERVVFGALGLMGLISHLPQRPRAIMGLHAEFHVPLRVGPAYAVHFAEDVPGRIEARVLDAGQVAVKAAFDLGSRRPSRRHLPEMRPRKLARRWTLPQLRRLPVIEGSYGPSRRALKALMRRWPASACLGPAQWAVLLWCSYFVGMELPGRQAILASLAVQLRPAPVGGSAPLTFSAATRRFDERFGLVSIEAGLTLGAVRIADVRMTALVRPDPRASLRVTTAP